MPDADDAARAGERRRRREVDRAILALALPALGALIAEPLFVATDTAMVGHLGSVELAAIGIAGTVLQSAIGLMNFLAYATTPLVARRLGAGDVRGAFRAGVDGVWIALLVGAVLAIAGWFGAEAIVTWFGAPPEVTEAAALYLRLSSLGIPGMLVLVAAVGLFRGLQDTRTPLVLAIAGSVANVAANAVLIYGLGWGIAGSAIGTAVIQSATGIAAVVIAARRGARLGVTLRWHPAGAEFVESLTTGGWVFLRTASLRIILLGTIAAATNHGETTLAATTVLFTVFFLIALGLDALAIAAQALVGHALGAADVPRVRAIVRRLLVLSLLSGLIVCAVLAALSPVLGWIFTTDPDVLAVLPAGVLVLALSTPIGAIVFALDGILLGAGDGRHLALLGLVNLAVMVPALWWVATVPLEASVAVVAIQLVFQVLYMVTRAIALGLRIRGTAWMRGGVSTRAGEDSRAES